MEVGNHGQKVGGRSSHLLPRLSIDRLITTDDGTISKGTVFAVVSRDIEHHNAGHKLEGSRETAEDSSHRPGRNPSRTTGRRQMFKEPFARKCEA